MTGILKTLEGVVKTNKIMTNKKLPLHFNFFLAPTGAQGVKMSVCVCTLCSQEQRKGLKRELKRELNRELKGELKIARAQEREKELRRVS